MLISSYCLALHLLNSIQWLRHIEKTSWFVYLNMLSTMVCLFTGFRLSVVQDRPTIRLSGSLALENHDSFNFVCSFAQVV